MAEITTLYRKWCKENGIKEASERRLANWFTDNSEQLGVHRTNNVVRNGKRLRGYEGLKIRPEWKNLSIVL